MPPFVATAQIPIALINAQETIVRSLTNGNGTSRDKGSEKPKPQPAFPESEKTLEKNLTIEVRRDCRECELSFYKKHGQFLVKHRVPSDKGEHFFRRSQRRSEIRNPERPEQSGLEGLESEFRGEYRYQFDYEHGYVNDLRRGFGRHDVRPFNAKLSHVKDETDTLTYQQRGNQEIF